MEKLSCSSQFLRAIVFPSNLEEFILECSSPGIDQSNLQEDEHSTDSKFSA